MSEPSDPTWLEVWWWERRLEPTVPRVPDPGTPDELFDASHWTRVYDAVTTAFIPPRYDMVALRERVVGLMLAPPGPKEDE